MIIQTFSNFPKRKKLILILLFTVHPCEKEARGGCSEVCNRDGVEAICACTNPKTRRLKADNKTCEKSKFI